MLTYVVCLCSAASADLVEKSQAAQKLLKVVIAGLSEDAHSEEVRKVLSVSSFQCTGSYLLVRLSKKARYCSRDRPQEILGYAQAIACSERVYNMLK